MRALLAALLAVLLMAAAPALAADEDAAALDLADRAVATAPPVSAWSVFSEAAWSESTLRAGGRNRAWRLSIDLRYDQAFAERWRVVFADRLDMRWQDDSSGHADINTLKEAYLSWRARPDRIADLGRINVRNGVAYGYNPTDYFRAGAVRSIVSIDPSSLRENRLGSVMLRGQALWAAGSFTALVSPKLADQPSDAAFNADLGATNRRTRWLLAASHKLSDAFNPQVLLYGGEGESAQLGLNLTALLNDATVAHVEWSGGRAPSLLSQALRLPDDAAFRSRLATGLSYTTASKLSLTLEYQYNGAGLDEAAWDALRSGPPQAYGAYRNFVADLQDPPTRRRIFLRAFWQDALLNHLDLTGMTYYDAVDASRQLWVEARYHWTRVDVALQWQRNSGQPGSDYGALPERRVWQALARVYF
jgi:opacity protein-like surface antigen